MPKTLRVILSNWICRLGARAAAKARRIAIKIAIGLGLCALAMGGAIIALAYLTGALWHSIEPAFGAVGADLALAAAWCMITFVAALIGCRILKRGWIDQL